MPKSRKRKLTRGQKLKGALRRAVLHAKNEEAVRPIYERAFPERQEYPPFSYERPEPKPKLKEAMPETPKPGSLVTHKDRRQYKVGLDGAWRVLNKPRSRVKRLRDELITKRAA